MKMENYLKVFLIYSTEGMRSYLFLTFLWLYSSGVAKMESVLGGDNVITDFFYRLKTNRSLFKKISDIISQNPKNFINKNPP